MLLTKFDPPAFLNDFTDAEKIAWSKFISDRIDAEMVSSPANGHHFYNPTKKDTAADQATATQS